MVTSGGGVDPVEEAQEERAGEEPERARPGRRVPAEEATRALTPDEPPGGRPGIHRRLYDWVLSWAETPYGTPALGALSFAEASFFPIPPDPLLMALCLGAPRRAYLFATITTAASVVGGIAGYAIGAVGWELLGGFFYQWIPGFTPDAFVGVQGLYARFDFWFVFLAGLTPLPFKVFTIASGIFGISLPVFVVAATVSRGVRFFFEAALLHRFGLPMAEYIDRNFNALTILFGSLVILGFVLAELIL